MSELRHSDDILGGIEVIQRRRVRIELIAENDDEIPHEVTGRGRSAPCPRERPPIILGRQRPHLHLRRESDAAGFATREGPFPIPGFPEIRNPPILERCARPAIANRPH